MDDLSFETQRRAMVASQLRTSAVSDPRVVAAMAEVPRERFVPAARRALAYVDTLVPLGDGRFLNPPAVIGRLLTQARTRPGDRALVLGAAPAYAAAVLARLVAAVTMLSEQAEPATEPAVTLATGALRAGWAAGAPYDLILIDGAVEEVPAALIAQLRDGGRLATGLLERGVTRLALGRRGGAGFGLAAFADAELAVLPCFARPRGFVF